eukprot:2012412-Prymnesium_polylepis.1
MRVRRTRHPTVLLSLGGPKGWWHARACWQRVCAPVKLPQRAGTNGAHDAGISCQPLAQGVCDGE